MKLCSQRRAKKKELKRVKKASVNYEMSSREKKIYVLLESQEEKKEKRGESLFEEII